MHLAQQNRFFLAMLQCNMDRLDLFLKALSKSMPKIRSCWSVMGRDGTSRED